MSSQFEHLKRALSKRYRLERPVGQGGMATVYLARDLKHQRDVAVKVLRPELVAALGGERFLLEIEIAARLTHPHIVPLFDSGEADGLLYYVQPFIDGETLGKLLARNGPIETDRVIRILIDVADALSKAHSLGVVHRDIKPDNIMLSDSHALVTDFGVAKAVTEAKERGLTTAGTALGTPTYMAPEQAAADPATDHRADIYSLGAVGYEMLTGRPPFAGANLHQIIAAHIKEQPSPIGNARNDIPADLEAIVMRCLEKKPEDRFASAEDLLSALGAFRGTPTPQRLTNPVATKRSRMLPMGAIALSLLALIAVLFLFRRPSGDSALNRDVIAVAPFDVLGPEHQMWSEGFAELLSHSFDGAGRLRTISPTVGFARWDGRSDVTSAAQFGNSLGAGLALFGRIVTEGQDSVRIYTTLIDVADGAIVRDLEVRGADRNMPSLADSVAASLLVDLSRFRSLGAARLNSLGSRSPNAIREFLVGESHYRSFQMDSAEIHYQRALAADSGFALAWGRLGMIAAWESNNSDEATTFRLMAGTLNTGLSARESLLVVADSLAASISEVWEPNPESARDMNRYFTTLRQANEWYPEDAQILYRMGEAQMHRGWAERVTESAALESFDRAAALDSAFALVYPHLMYLRYSFENIDSGNEATRAYLAQDPSGPTRVGGETVLELTRQLARGEQAFLDTASAFQLLGPVGILHRAADSNEAAVQAGRRLALRDPSNLYLPAAAVAFRGHLREARSIIGTPSITDGWMLLAEIDYIEGADELLGRFDDAPTLTSIHPLLAMTHWAERGDTNSIQQLLLQVETGAAGNRHDSQAWRTFFTERAAAFLTLARGDSADALAQFDALPDYRCRLGCGFQQLTHARLLERSGRYTEAVQLLEPFPSGLFSNPFPVEVLWVLERARAREAARDLDGARLDYARVVDVWQNGDESVQAAVLEAKSALERLGSEARN